MQWDYLACSSSENCFYNVLTDSFIWQTHKCGVNFKCEVKALFSFGRTDVHASSALMLQLTFSHYRLKCSFVFYVKVRDTHFLNVASLALYCVL